MAKRNTGTSNTSATSMNARPAQASGASNYQGTPRTTAITPQPVKPAAGLPLQTKAIALPRLSHEQIARRAMAIWEKKGHPTGQDEQNWLQAETELRTELQA